jgi:Uncharacterized conserved protein (DUF2190)
MSYEIPSFLVGVFPADVNMSTLTGNTYPFQYTGVCVYTAISTQGAGIGGAAIIPPSAASTPMIGVLQNAPQQGEAGTVMIGGVTKAVAGGSFSIGALLMVNSSGQFVLATSGNYAVAQALETAVSGDITTVLLIRNGKQ